MNELESLRELISKRVTDSDIIAAVIYKINITTVPKDLCFFQQAFFTLKQNEPELLKNFSFDNSGIHPFSDELDATLFRLEASTILPTLNPSYKNYAVINNIDILKTSYYKFSRKDQKKIDNISKLFLTDRAYDYAE